MDGRADVVEAHFELWRVSYKRIMGYRKLTYLRWVLFGMSVRVGKCLQLS